MLGTLTPLGERTRGNNWLRTVIAYIVGSSVAGALVGGVWGWMGALASPATVGSGGYARPILGGALVAAIAIDLNIAGLRLPSVRRQVNDLWLYRYRGWVYGFGFGVQLGFGLATMVISAAFYVALLAEWLSGSARGGALVGLTFGFVRAIPVLFTYPISEPSQVFAVASLLERGLRPGRIIAAIAMAAIAVWMVL